ncbi:MAG: hypothetical protein ACN2B6_04725 [Rickettsiales bacterium]
MTDSGDIHRLAGITRNMIGHLEQAVELNDQGLLDEANPLAKTYGRLFGSKASYVDILTDLSVLMIKLHTTSQTLEKKDETEESDAQHINMDAKDMQLIKAFIDRQKTQSKP